MSGSWFFDANFNGISDDFFDDVIKFVDFPLEDVDDCNNGEDWEARFKGLETPPASVLAGLSFSDDFGCKSNDIKKEDILSYGETFQLPTQGSTTYEPSGSQTTITKKSTKTSTNGKDSFLFQTSSPVSVLESSSSCSVENTKTFDSKLVFRTKGTRSKRRPHSTFNKLHSLPFLSPAAVASSAAFSASTLSHTFSTTTTTSDDSESETHFADTTARKKLKKKRNLTLLSGTSETKKALSDQPVMTRKCMHCEVTKTPQWREGPMGPKTLCNACGVRYRSGRLLPEYRPAASPTFVPTIHSNSHKKVVEMRKKCSGPISSSSTGTMGTTRMFQPDSSSEDSYGSLLA